MPPDNRDSLTRFEEFLEELSRTDDAPEDDEEEDTHG